MWIRSQDRNRLAKADDICIYIYSDGTSEVRMKSCRLGQYSTEEKAIKVLDMIQKQILDYITNDVDFAFNHPKVFQMPQDSEVE